MRVSGEKWELLVGDCRERLREVPAESVDVVICDPPYELGFMGKGWDRTGIAYDVAVWRECLRVLKPGGHLAAFGGTRTVHRMVCAIEDAGFEIRDGLTWIYGSGFPKSLDVSKAIDRKLGVVREVVGVRQTRDLRGGNCHGASESRPPLEHAITAPASEEAKVWEGWGTALKPAQEPICLARKPLRGTVAECVLRYGTGGMNIGAARIAAEKATGWGGVASSGYSGGLDSNEEARPVEGRWPANVVHDGSAEVVGLFPVEAGAGGVASGPSGTTAATFGVYGERSEAFHADSGSAARFFASFPWEGVDHAVAEEDRQVVRYCAKASAEDREDGLEGMAERAGIRSNAPRDGVQYVKRPPRRNHHPTVKPEGLMRWLVRLLCRPGGRVCDPFTGSGSTGKAALLEGCEFVGCELTGEYVPIIEGRLRAAAARRVEEMGLLDAAGEGMPEGGLVWVESELFPAA